MDLTRWGRPIGITLVAALALYTIAVAQARPQALASAALRIGAFGVLVGCLVCVAATMLRFLRWQMLLYLLGEAPPWGSSLRVYWAGVALTWTPGKLGETFRSVLLRPHGVRVADSLAAFLADRLSDVVGVALLGLLAAGLSGRDTDLFVAIVLLSLLASLAVAKGISRGWLKTHWRIAAPLQRWALVWSPQQVLLWVALAALAYGLQALVFAAFTRTLAAEIGWASCVAVFAAAIFVGAASMVPAGLGAMEATLAFALKSMGLEWGDAVAVTLLTRLCTLWIPGGLGVVALLGLVRAPTQTQPVAQA